MVQLSSLLTKEQSVPRNSTELSKLKLPGSASILKSDGTGFEEDHSGIEIQPTAGFVIKTKSGGSKVFINICYCDKIENPGIKRKLDDDGKEVEGWNVPLSMGPIRQCLDKINNMCSVVDAVMHPSVQENIDLDTSGAHRNFICQILMQCFDQKYKELSPLDRKYSLPNTKYIGYMNVKTGEIVRKMGKDVEICKQYIKDTSSRPKIILQQEDVSQTQQMVKNDATTPLQNKKSETLSWRRDMANDTSSTNEMNAITTTIKTTPPLLLPVDVYLQIHVDGGGDKLLTVQEFLDAIHQHRQDPGKVTSVERKHIPVALPTEWDTTSTLPLILDISEFEPYLKVSRVIVQASTSSKFCPESIEIYVSTFCLKVMTKSQQNISSRSRSSSGNISKTPPSTARITEKKECITECILPFCVNTQEQHVKCTYNPNIHLLSISMDILSTSTNLCQKADIGSEPWLMANALSLTRKDEGKKKTNKKKKDDDKNDNNGGYSSKNAVQSHENNVSYDDDPFHLKSPFPWKQQIQSSKQFMTTTTTTTHQRSHDQMSSSDTANKKLMNKSTTTSAVRIDSNDILPEDRFHQNDCMSQYLIEKQQQAQQQRSYSSSSSEEETRTSTVSNTKQETCCHNASTSDSMPRKNDFESIDFVSSSTSRTNNGDEMFLDEDIAAASDHRDHHRRQQQDQEHIQCLKHAEEMLLKRCCPPPALLAPTVGDGVHTNSYKHWWYKMMH